MVWPKTNFRTGLWDEHQIAKSLEGILEAAFAPAAGADNSTRTGNNAEAGTTTAADDILALLEVFVFPTNPIMEEESESKALDLPGLITNSNILC